MPIVPLAAALLSLSTGALPVSVQSDASGTVFIDQNGDGARQPGERGLPGVLVTNGQDVVRTDTRGVFTIPLRNAEDSIISVVDPAGYASPRDSLGIPRFYHIHKPQGSPDSNYIYSGVPATGQLPQTIDFPLVRDTTGGAFDVILVGDPQPYNPGEVSLYARDVVSELRNVEADFAFALGDLVGDDLNLYPIYNEANSLSGHTWRNVHGNHDVNFMSPTDQHSDETFEATFGPADYAFYRGEALFIVLDNVLWQGFDGYRSDGDPKRGNYIGDISDRQVRFVRALLDNTPRETLVVVAVHIPFMGDGPRENTRGFEKLLAAMSSHPNTLSVSGHTHKQRHEYFGPEDGYTTDQGTEHHHYNVGTASGTWWRGDTNERGIPHAMMRDGTPNGFAVLSIKENTYSISYKAAGFPESFQINIHAPDASAGGEAFTANVFNGCERTTVEYQIGENGSWRTMERVWIPDPHYTALYEQELEDNKRRKLWEPEPSSHIWQANLPADIPAGTSWLTIRATDPYGHQHRASTPVRNNAERAAPNPMAGQIPSDRSSETGTGRLERIAFGSCSKESNPQPIWQTVSAAKPDVFILAGDNVYGDTNDPAVLRAKYDRFNAIPGFAALRSHTPLLATWDDHDFGRNDAGREYEMKEDSQQIFLDFMNVASDSPRREREGIYHAEIHGQPGERVQVILLDTRYHRSEPERFARQPGERSAGYRPTRDRDATILGEAQWQWLEEQLREPAELRLIVSSIQFVASDHRFEKWANFPFEQSRMLRLIRDTNAQGVLFLSGDRHHAELSRLEHGTVDYPIYDLTASGINQSRPRSEWRSPEMNRHRLEGPFRGSHFGVVDIDWESPDPLVSLAINDISGEPVIHHSLRLSEIRSSGRSPVTYEEPMPTRAGGPALSIDGNTQDRPAPVSASIVQGHFSAAFRSPTERTLRRHAEMVEIGLDLDADTSTGSQSPATHGDDLTILIGAPPEPGQRWRRGPKVVRHNADGTSTDVTDPEALTALGFHIAPTHASSTHEFTIDLAEATRIANADIQSAETVRATVSAIDRETGERTLWNSLRAETYAGDTRAAHADHHDTVPSKQNDAIRVVALNVLWGQPQENPEPFARIFRATQPDIYLIQEWDQRRYSVAEICAWFREHVDPDAEWDAMVTGVDGFGSGTAVVTPHPITAKLAPAVPVDADRWDFPARIAAAAVDTPAGTFVTASVHFKAGGSLDSGEDVRRLAEAEAVNRILAGMNAVASPEVVVLGGDFNLNGSTEIAKRAIGNADIDLSDLTLANARILGDPRLVYTHGRGPQKNRLDFIAYSDSTAEISTAFVLDTSVLSDSALSQSGLRASDTSASDHLPVFIDLVTRRQLAAPTAR